MDQPTEHSVSTPQFSDSELAERATKVYQLVGDLTFDQACKVLNAVLSVRTDAWLNPIREKLDSKGDIDQLVIQDGKARPHNAAAINGPQLDDIEAACANALRVKADNVAVCGDKSVGQQPAKSVCRYSSLKIGDIDFGPIL